MRKLIIANLGWFLLLPFLHGYALADSHQDMVTTGGKNPFLQLSEDKKIIVGQIEDVILVPWAIRFPARIDTGAAMSSLDARDIVVRNNIAEFKLGNKYGEISLQLPFTGWRHIRTSMGIEKRPVVELTLCMGPKVFRTLATLRDRSKMTYPFLIGRHALNGSFMVDTSISRVANPSCSYDALASRGAGAVVSH